MKPIINKSRKERMQELMAKPDMKDFMKAVPFALFIALTIWFVSPKIEKSMPRKSKLDYTTTQKDSVRNAYETKCEQGKQQRIANNQWWLLDSKDIDNK